MAVALLLACNRVPRSTEGEGATGQAPLELRDPRGQPTFTLQRIGDGFRYTEAGAGGGRVTPAPGGRFRTEDPRRGPLEAWRLEGGGVEIRGREGTLLRLTREGKAWRLGDGVGIPLGRVRLDRAGEEAVGHDAGGMVVVRVRAGGGRLVVSDRQGATTALFTGALEQLSLDEAALAALPALGAAERALLLVAAGGV